MQLEESVINNLIDKRLSLSLAESITGGLICSKLVSVPNASKVVKCSLVTYSNESKNRILGVSKKVINNYSPVSRKCAKMMVLGLKNKIKSDIYLAITGYAGPLGEKIGLVYIAILYNKRIKIKKFRLRGDRSEIINEASNIALSMINKAAKKI